MKDIKIIERIEALFRQAEGTNIPEEALTFTQKAQELLTKYALSELDLASVKAGRMDDHVLTVGIVVNEPQAKRKQELLASIAKVNDIKPVLGNANRRWGNGPIDAGYGAGTARVVSSDKENKNYRIMYLTGFSKDIEATTLLYTSLLIQARGEIKRAQVPSWENKATWVNHFFIGFTQVVRQRLQKSRNDDVAKLKEDASVGGFDLLPVIVERSKRVEAQHEETWKGKLGKARGAYTRSSTSGYSSGRDAGGRSDVGQTRLGGVGALARG